MVNDKMQALKEENEHESQIIQQIREECDRFQKLQEENDKAREEDRKRMLENLELKK